MSAIDHFWAVIPAGGAGTRLWPLSRSSSPKFLHDLTGSGLSLLRETHERLAPLAGDRFLVVTGAAHREAVRAQLADLGEDAVLAEPSPRDSMAAIGLAAALLERRDPDAVMGSFAADHVIADRAGFATCVETAVGAARAGWLVTLGIEPTHPSSAFGYIHLGEDLADLPGVRGVRAFVEKPDAATAATYVTQRYLWNSGNFLFHAATMLGEIERCEPAMARSAAANSGSQRPSRSSSTPGRTTNMPAFQRCRPPAT